MSIARGDEGPGNATRKRSLRKAAAEGASSAQSTTATVPAVPPPERSITADKPGLRLDDLYRLPMPQLFAFAEKHGVPEHTGMNRGQLIAAVVRRQVERGEVV